MANFFARNEHPIERVVRVSLGLGLLAITQLGPQTAWGYLGVIPLVTGLFGSCPLYSMLGINTCPVGKR